ncbi:lysophospholipid acyltransferase family protein [Corynebacterium choanae]|uniref:1-acyl-sn-glycerol-3-phosphate acyltransferase n=1 Tax=Corynebacterium choanae TaxID=1862358 RepID=A0A3G6J7X0_9CORY|nr:1-acyl-sn-glycerol-3-phosphate acyltransferase [Corynebacterium choanae]AZA12540.1 1-acyl-sn-glycerol-3-phosphate acyltransferase [Corynebacterium choanae]
MLRRNTPDYHQQGMFRVPADLQQVDLHHSEAVETFYSGVTRAVRAVMRAQDLQITVDGAEHIPASGGALLAINHTGYFDFVFAGIPAYLRGKRLVRFMAKKEVFQHKITGPVMRAMKHISVDRSQGRGSLEEAVDRLKEGQLVGIFPESTISRSFLIREELKTGAARIADQAGVPLLPVIVFGSHRIWTKEQPKHFGRHSIPIMIEVGPPLELSGDSEADTALLHETLEEMLDRVISRYIELYGPFDDRPYWLPQRYGGSAPTPEQARVRHQKELAMRRQKKEQKLNRTIERKATSAMEKLTPKGRTLWAKVKRNVRRLLRR